MSARRDRTLALAGVFQTAALVHRLAWHGIGPNRGLEASLGSLFRFDTQSTLSVFGDLGDIRPGLNALVAHLSGEAGPDEAPVMRYVLGLIHLERCADSRDGTWRALHEGLQLASRQVNNFGVEHENTVAALAALYADHISPAGPRIMVEGESLHLRDPRTAALIRALLLAGIRSAVLWRQLGASRWSLLFGRRGMLSEARALV